MPIKILIFGIDNAGKTALNTMMRVGEPPKITRPTLSFDINSLITKDLRFELWDAPGQVNLRKKWERGIIGSQILMFILDVADKGRYEEAKKELDKVLANPDVENAPLVICFHKMDLEESSKNIYTAKEIIQRGITTRPNTKIFETSIYRPKVVKEIIDYIVKIAIENRWG